MNAKTMEGLTGASTSINMISTPMSVAKEAERKGETDRMIRALGYAEELNDQAGRYSETAREGMKLDAQEAKKQEKLRREKLIEARRKEREEQEKRLEAETGKSENVDSAEISEEGKSYAETAGAPSAATGEGTQDMTYDRSGEVAAPVQETGGNMDLEG